MGFLKNIFGVKNAPAKSYEDFWAWFKKNEKAFYKVINEDGDIEQDFFDKLSPKLEDIEDGFFTSPVCLAIPQQNLFLLLTV